MPSPNFGSYRELNPSILCNPLSHKCFCSKETLEEHLATLMQEKITAPAAAAAAGAGALLVAYDSVLVDPRPRLHGVATTGYWGIWGFFCSASQGFVVLGVLCERFPPREATIYLILFLLHAVRY